MLLALPNELLLLVASALATRDLASLILTNRRLSSLLAPTLTALAVQDYRALHHAVCHGYHDAMHHYLSHGVPASVADKDNSTALHKAAGLGDEAAVRLLLDHGAALEVETTSYKETPLLVAAAGASEGVVRMLLGKGADPNAANLDGMTVLRVVFAWRRWAKRDAGWERRVLELLVEHGADRGGAVAY